MNYCSIDEAWHTSNIMNNYVTHLNKNQELIQEYYNGPSEQNNRNQFMEMEKQITHKPIDKPTIEHFNDNNNCDDIMDHINNCKKCYDKLKEHFEVKPTIKPIENMMDQLLTKGNREILSYILIGILIVIVLDIVYSLGKSK